MKLSLTFIAIVSTFVDTYSFAGTLSMRPTMPHRPIFSSAENSALIQVDSLVPQIKNWRAYTYWLWKVNQILFGMYTVKSTEGSFDTANNDVSSVEPIQRNAIPEVLNGWQSMMKSGGGSAAAAAPGDGAPDTPRHGIPVPAKRVKPKDQRQAPPPGSLTAPDGKILISDEDGVFIPALIARVEEAQRYHQNHPSSKRHLRPPVDGTSAAAAPAPERQGLPADSGMWDYVRDRTIKFWAEDTANSVAKYQRCQEWLTILELWDLDKTWDDINVCPKTRSDRNKAAYLARLAKIPPGDLFERITVPHRPHPPAAK